MAPASVVWLNGPFGVGKSTTSRLLAQARPDWVLLDTERVGELLMPVLGPHRPVPDFQDWPAWRSLTIASILAVSAEFDHRRTVVVPQTVVVRAYFDELAAGLAGAGLDVAWFTLDVDSGEHRRRIAEDAEMPGSWWRTQRRADYDTARPWLSELTTLIDTTRLTPEQVVAAVLAAVDRVG